MGGFFCFVLLPNIYIFVRKTQLALEQWDGAVYVIFTPPLKRVVNKRSRFILSGLWQLRKVCQLSRRPVLRGSMSPGRAGGGRRAGVEVQRSDESVQAVPQKLHPRVKSSLGWLKKLAPCFPVVMLKRFPDRSQKGHLWLCALLRKTERTVWFEDFGSVIKTI